MKIESLKKQLHLPKVKNESGMVLVTAMLLMVVLTLIGAAAMSIRNVEQSVTKNTEIYVNNFYNLEAVTLEGVSEIEAMSDATLLDPTAFPAWLKEWESEAGNPDIIKASLDLTFEAQWPSGSIIPQNTTLDTVDTNITPTGYLSDGTAAGDRIWYAAHSLGACAGADLTQPDKVESCYNVYGMYDVKPGAGKSHHGKMMMMMGFKKVLYP